jgi:hypothetical protein
MAWVILKLFSFPDDLLEFFSHPEHKVNVGQREWTKTQKTAYPLACRME